MARIEFPEEIRKKVEAIGPADLVVGIAGAIHRDDLRARVGDWLRTIGSSPLKTVVVYSGAQNASEEISPETIATGPWPAEDGTVQFLAYPGAPHDPSFGPWAESSAAQRIVLSLAALLGARACAVLHRDLAALDETSLRLLAAPVLDGQFDLVTPIYPEGRYEGLINKSLLAPLSRALFGRRVHSPLAFDFCAGARMLPQLADTGAPRGQAGPPLLWPANCVAMQGGQIGQARLHAVHTTSLEGLELSAVLAQLAGGLFQEAETCAPQWQRVRGSQPAAISPPDGISSPDAPESTQPEPVDARPLIESFLLGSRNLEEVWRLVLPPVSLFDLKRLTRLAPDQFRMADDLWARIIYDFALGYRLRRIGRSHLLGALTPLYLGWVASYAQEVASATPSEVDERVERVACAFEENKPYFVSRWRWPDRSN